MTHNSSQDQKPFAVVNPNGRAPVVLVCEHASNSIPPELDNLGLGPAALVSHIAWDPGAGAVAAYVSAALDAALIIGTVSRLVYDCNRPPEAPDAIPRQSETTDIPGNADLTGAARARRAAAIHGPFHKAVAAVMAARPAPILVTIHSFTPVYGGQRRDAEIGVLHDTDSRLADAMLALAGDHLPFACDRNVPYGPEDGVTHTLQLHGLPHGHRNVMLEIRNDLIATSEDQQAMARRLGAWIMAALDHEARP